jgi:hypothetical protein
MPCPSPTFNTTKKKKACYARNWTTNHVETPAQSFLDDPATFPTPGVEDTPRTSMTINPAKGKRTPSSHPQRRSEILHQIYLTIPMSIMAKIATPSYIHLLLARKLCPGSPSCLSSVIYTYSNSQPGSDTCATESVSLLLIQSLPMTSVPRMGAAPPRDTSQEDALSLNRSPHCRTSDIVSQESSRSKPGRCRTA